MAVAPTVDLIPVTYMAADLDVATDVVMDVAAELDVAVSMALT